MSLAELIAEARRSGDWSTLEGAIPYAQLMNISMSIATGELLGKLTYSDMLIGNAALPALHGGTLAALLESTAIFTVLWEAETVVMPKTINLTIDYLRSGKPMDVLARGIITRHGRRVVNVRAEAWQEDRSRPISIANLHFLISPLGDR